jgi:phosphate transport system protein
MRQHYHEQLEEVSRYLVEMSKLVETAMERSTRALLNADLPLAESVINGDEAIDALAMKVEDECVSIIALQQPVASELRAIIGALRMCATLERMGDLAEHIAKQARMRHPNLSIPTELRATFSMMGAIATSVVQKVAGVLETRNLALAGGVALADDEMDRLHRELFTTVLSPSWTHGVEAAIDVTLLSRYYERFADHGVSIARRIAYIVTGELPTKSELAGNA